MQDIPKYIKNPNLWRQAIQEVNKVYKKHSAYRSLAYFKYYLNLGGEFDEKILNSKQRELRRWKNEEWRNQEGETGYKNKGDIYRPTKRINKNTPLTFGELDTEEIEEAMKEKEASGRVLSFRKKPHYNLYKSPKPDKKYMVQVNIGDTILYTVHFGGVRKNGIPYMDYIQYYDKEGKTKANKMKRAYIKRHSVNEDFKDYKSPAFWSLYILWNKPNLKESFLDAVDRAKKLMNN